MAVFPTLSMKPSVSEWDEGVAQDPTISTDFENGFRQTYPAFTRIVDRWKVGYIALPRADKDVLRAFEKTVKVGSNAFTWTNPIDNINRTVRFKEPIQYKPHNTIFYWDVSFILEEV